MNDYKELIELLAHPTDGRDSADIMIAAADAIEQIVAEYNELDNAHDELFIEYHKVKKQRDAAIAVNGSRANITRSCNSKTRKAYGYKWMWAGERKEGADNG